MNHTDPSFYATLAGLGEAVLIGVLDKLDNQDRIAGFEAFVTMIAREGVPFPFFAENLKVDTVQAVGDDDSPKREIEFGHTTFARVIAEALATPPANDAEKAMQANWVPQIMEAMPSRNLELNLLNNVLFEFSSRGGDPALVAHLVDEGANPDIPRESRYKNAISTPLTCFGEAVAHGRLDKAIALLPYTNPDAAIKTLQHICEGHPPVPGEQQQQFLESTLMGGKLAKAPAPVLEFLDKLDAEFGAETARGVRGTVLKGYLKHCNGFGRNWDSNTLELLCTKHSPSSPSSLWRDFHDLFEGEGSPTWLTFGSWMHLARDALYVGCAPVLEALAPMIRQQSVNGMCEGLDIGKSLRGTPMGDPYVPEQFKAAMSVLVAQGLSMNTTGDKDVPLVFNLAATGKHTLSKLAILLELGMDPHAQKEPGDTKPVTDFIMDPAVKSRWESIVRSFEARKTAHGLLSELDSPSP